MIIFWLSKRKYAFWADGEKIYYSKITLCKSFSSIFDLTTCSNFFYFSVFLLVVLWDVEAKNLLIFLSTIETHFAKWYFLFVQKHSSIRKNTVTSKKVEEFSCYMGQNISLFFCNFMKTLHIRSNIFRVFSIRLIEYRNWYMMKFWITKCARIWCERESTLLMNLYLTKCQIL